MPVKQMNSVEVFTSGAAKCALDFRGDEDERVVVILSQAAAKKLADDLLTAGYCGAKS